MHFTMRIKSLIVIAVGLLVLAGCSRPHDKRVESFVAKTEANCEKYTDADWEKSVEEYSALAQEYKDNYKAFTKEERERINEAFGKYTRLMLKRGASAFDNALKDAADEASSFLKGIFGSDDDD